ncbi:MAG: hypothetical protein B1H03_05955 [Planctomycetales bacterium 4484_113]|nr:MAG: hypothetical protein B1H03_05955 [Planctomycetales bacterium 4484_113]
MVFARRRILRRRYAAVPGVMIAPLIDAVLILLIFFMLISRYLQPTVELTLPESRAAAEPRVSVAVSITAQGTLSFEGTQVSAEELAVRLAAIDPHKVKMVLLRADERVPLKRVVEVLDVIRSSPLKSVALEVRRK